MTERTDASYYPVSLNVTGKACLVVGGGPVAARKAKGLLSCGALVTVIAPKVCGSFEDLAPITVERRTYTNGDAANYRLVVTATGIPEVDGAVFSDANSSGVWVNSADDRDHSSFILPSVHRDGSVTVSVSTGGSSPALATWLRTKVAAQLGNGLGDLAEMLATVRHQLQDAGVSTETVDWVSLLEGSLPDLVRAGRIDQARALVAEATGVTS